MIDRVHVARFNVPRLSIPSNIVCPKSCSCCGKRDGSRRVFVYNTRDPSNAK